MKRQLIALVLYTLATGVAIAGGSDLEQLDDHAEGLKFFGEAKDIKGFAPLSGVTISGLVKGQKLPMMAQTDEDGRFKLSGFAENVKGENVEISCRKTGYRVVDISVKAMGAKPDDPVAVECLLARD